MFWNYISLMRFEILSLGAIVLFLLNKIFSEKDRVCFLLSFGSLFLFIILIAGFFIPSSGSLFGGMFVMDSSITIQKSVVTLATFLISLQARYWLKQQEHYIEFYLLLFSVITGMYFLLSSGNFLMFYLGLEMATIPLAALAAFDFGRIRSAEGAGKMILSSAFSSAIMLFGLSLVYGTTGSLDFKSVNELYSFSFLQLFALGFVFVGFAFKVSAVPFHLWTADVYEGAPIPITTFLSVVSKGASIFILMTVLYRVFGEGYTSWKIIVVSLAAITMTIGNIFAIRQTNIKRFFAFSSITQAGYMLIGVAAASQAAMASVVYFILIYIFSNIGAFTVVSIITDRTGREDLDDYKGLYKTNPKISIIMMLAVFSLAGIPPTAGFFGKLFLLSSAASSGLLILLTIASLNMIISLYYYLKIVKLIIVDDREDRIGEFSTDLSSKIVLFICGSGIIVVGFLNIVFEYIHEFSFGL